MRDQGGARRGPPILLPVPAALSGQKNGAKTEACDPGTVDMSLLYIPTSTCPVSSRAAHTPCSDISCTTMTEPKLGVN